MLATVLHGKGDVRVEERPNAALLTPTDAVVRVVAACVCGSDLWAYRGITKVDEPRLVGHEFVGIVEQVGRAVQNLAVGDFVVSPFNISDGTCEACCDGVPTACEHGAFFGRADEHGHLVSGCQGQYVRVPLADGTLVVVPGPVDDALIPHLLALSDVMSTGHHAAVRGGVTPGSTVVVVGDGAVGLCAVLSAKRAGADRIIAMSRHADRQRLAIEFGATDVVAERGTAGAKRVRELLGGKLADCVLEAVGTKESLDQAIASVRVGGRIGFVGMPYGIPELPYETLFWKNLTVGAGAAAARDYIEELLPEVLSGSLQPGKVFDAEYALTDIAQAYRDMDERRTIKALIRL
ncbi:alcohol dehydrogenase catalytic domain-containing protein [Salinibacterium sp. ZJ450]|uniref:zinc-binding dehydrogenase n=1 Tax=Salinibacterium sp. ZJ450 TaxID=2708338 RepID=UPI00141F05BA|nr:alcohol dehydrogenase catalytic domain-containing protein [Salinibacterium sp. ZJ450]